MRASLLFQSQSDWIDNTYTKQDDALGGQQTWAGRLQLLWAPSEKFTALANVHGWDLDGTARMFRANIIEKGTSELVDGYEQDRVSYDGLNQQTIQAFGGVLKLDYDFGSATLTSVTGYETLDKMYSRGDIDGGYGAVFAPPSGPGLIPFPSESADGLPKLDQFTQEVRLASDTKGRWDWLLGFYYFDESLQADTFSYTTLAPGNPVEGYAFQTQDASSWAGFASVDFRPTDRWSLKGGLRYTTDQKDFSAERPDPTFQLPTLRPIEVSTDADLVTWDLSATYKATGNVNLYSRVGTGFRAPSIQGRILFCADFEGGQNPDTNCMSADRNHPRPCACEDPRRRGLADQRHCGKPGATPRQTLISHGLQVVRRHGQSEHRRVVGCLPRPLGPHCRPRAQLREPPRLIEAVACRVALRDRSAVGGLDRLRIIKTPVPCEGDRMRRDPWRDTRTLHEHRPARVARVDRVPLAVRVAVEAERVSRDRRRGVGREEARRGRVVGAGGQVVEAG